MMSMMFLLTSLTIMLYSILMMYKATIITINIPLFPMLSTNLSISLIMDWMSMTFMSTVLMISSMIMIFSFSYIPKTNHNQFMLMLIMFIMSMLILIISDNIFLLILGWDGLGLTSYILVIFYQNHSSSASGTITILMNRLGDIAILLTLAILFFSMNWSFNSITHPYMILLLLMIAALSKSAQFPLSAWLPAAMAAPTPISALVHSSTLVTAGVFLIIRLTKDNHPSMMMMLMIISSMTAIYSSLSAMWENDLKKIIAMSTLSQIAIMMFSISLGAPLVAFIHLIIHAYFKSSMFLCACSLIHNYSYQDMRHMNSQLLSSPIITSMLGLNSMALMGVPFMSGFFSKDAIIEFMLTSKLNSIMMFIMISSIMWTSLYTLRMNMMSTSMKILSKPDISLHNNNHINVPIFTLSSSSIFLGATMSWMTNPTQIFLMPYPLKMSIMLSLTTGLVLSMAFPTKNKYFISMTETAISLWFLHFMSTYHMKSSNKITNKPNLLDNTWQEMYGPLIYWKQNMMWASKINKTTSNIMIILIMISLTPIMLLM